jgi:hypothetical protein
MSDIRVESEQHVGTTPFVLRGKDLVPKKTAI